eukprot:m51a1_g11847 hypothetical protein (686) ;mRNA; f:478277-481218
MSLLRPRQLDLSKVMTIVQDNNGSEQSFGRAAGQLNTGMEKEDENEKHINTVLRNRELSAIPVPKCTVVEEPEDAAAPATPYDRGEFPRSAACGAPDEEFDKRPTPTGEYDIDEADAEWLDAHHSAHLDTAGMEAVVEAWERAAFIRGGVELPHAGTGSGSKQPKAFLYAPPPQVLYELPLAEAKEVASRVVPGIPPPLAAELYAHWMARRSARVASGNLLLHRYRYSLEKPQDYWDCEPVRDPAAYVRVRKMQQLVRRCEEMRKELGDAAEILARVLERDRLKRDIINDAARIVMRRMGETGSLAQLASVSSHSDSSSSSEDESSLWGCEEAISTQSWLRRVRKLYVDPEPASPAPSDRPVVELAFSRRRRRRSAETPAAPDPDAPEQPPAVMRRVTVGEGGKLTLHGVGSFRGRARVGRGGRILFDRFAIDPDGDAVLADVIPLGHPEQPPAVDTRTIRVVYLHGIKGSVVGTKALYLSTQFALHAPSLPTWNPFASLLAAVRAIQEWSPHVVVGSSYGAALLVWLMQRGEWRGPAVLISPAIGLALPFNVWLPQTAPVAILHGTRDTLVPLDHSRMLAATAGGMAELIEVDDEHPMNRITTDEEGIPRLRDVVVDLYNKQYGVAPGQSGPNADPSLSLPMKAEESKGYKSAIILGLQLAWQYPTGKIMRCCSGCCKSSYGHV